MTFQRAIKAVYDGAPELDTADELPVSRCITGSPSAFSLAASILLDYANRFPPADLVDEVVDETRIGIDVPLLEQAVKARITAIATALFNQSECGEVDAVARVPGEIMWFGGSGLPAGWLYCNGDEVLKASYPALWNAISDFWGTPQLGADYFVLPDYRNRSPYGYDVGSSPAHFMFGSYHGAENHTLTTAQMPVHSHASYSAGKYTAAQAGSGAGVAMNGAGTDFTINTGNAGGGNPHNNLQPVAVCGVMIFAGV